jgi:hypothetical protein
MVVLRALGGPTGPSLLRDASVIGLLLGFASVPFIYMLRRQSIVRTLSRAALAGCACGAGAGFFHALIGAMDGGQALIASLFLTIMAALFSLLFVITIAVLNRIRPPLPIQNGTLCPQCAYSIIGNVSGICPECGCAKLPNRDVLLNGRVS